MTPFKLDSAADSAFISAVEAESGQQVRLCYQCGNCTAGCPYSFVYDYPVNQIMRLVQAGQKDAVLGSKSIWLCGTCQSCTTRCPNNIDVARIMDVLRHMARRERRVAQENVKSFTDAFLDSVRAHGRVFELGIMIDYIMRSGRFWTDADLAPKMLPKGKLAFKAHDIQGKEAVARIFERFEKHQHGG